MSLASEYPLGENTIIYKARGFETGKIIECILWSPLLKEKWIISLAELEHGLYWAIHDFNYVGIYNAIFLENGDPKQFHAFRVVSKTFRP